MFGLSLTKLLLLAILILIVWYGFKYAARVEAIKQQVRAEVRRRREGGAPRGDLRSAPRPVEDLVKCGQCGAFVSAQGAANCGKPQCPWGA
jgi:uncharacterized protein